MKKIIMIASMLLTTAVFAARTEVDTPMINFGNASVEASNVCLDGNELVTKTPVTFCSNYSRQWVADSGNRADGHYETTCEDYSTETLTRSREYTQQRCAFWNGRRTDADNCGRYETVVKKVPLSYDYGVYKVQVRRGEVFKKLIEKRNVTVQSCN